MHHQAGALHRKWAAQSPGNCPCESETSIERGHPISCRRVEHAGMGNAHRQAHAHRFFFFPASAEVAQPRAATREVGSRLRCREREEGIDRSVAREKESAKAQERPFANLGGSALIAQVPVRGTPYDVRGRRIGRGRKGEGGVQLGMSPHLNVSHALCHPDSSLLSPQLAFLPVPSHTRNSTCRHRGALDLSKLVPLPSIVRPPMLTPAMFLSFSFCFVHDTHTLLI